MNAFQARKEAAVAKAQAFLATARTRHEVALREYERQVEIHEAERADGFFSADYLKARREAVLATKNLAARNSALITAIAERDAATLSAEWPSE